MSTGAKHVIAEKTGPPPQRITPRAVLIGLLLIPPTAWWLTQIEYVRYSDNATTSALFFHCISLLLILVGIKALLDRFLPRYSLARGEILIIYIMLVVASALIGHDQLHILFTTIAWPIHNATPENRWANDILPFIPQHLIITDEYAITKLFAGDSSFYAPDIWRAWVGPLGWWAAFTMGLVWTFLCLTTIFRRQWDYERLNYPIAGVPIELTSPRTIVYRSTPFWIAFFGAAIIQLIRLAHNLWPSVPTINIGVQYFSFNSMPFAAMGSVPISSYPFSYGMAYLLPLQLAFSVFFFFWFARLQLVVAAMFGYTQWNRFPFIQQQGVGAYFGLTVFVLWAARSHLAKLWAAATGRRDYPESQHEPMPPAWAVWGFIAGVIFIIGFSVAAGMSLTTALCFFALFFPIVLSVMRIRAELGLPTIELYQVGVDDMLQNIAGGSAFSARDRTVMTLFFFLTRTYRQLPPPIQADAFRIADQSGISLRGMSGILLLAAAVGIISSFWLTPHVLYNVGIESAKMAGPAKWAFGDEPWRKLSQWLANPRHPDLGSSLAYVWGVGFTLLLAYMRTRYVWWPFHPVGYLISGSGGLFRLWLPIFFTWLFKSLLLRYGGLKAYRRAYPFFFGLICGEFAAAFLRTIIDLVFNLYLPPESGVGGL